MAIKRFLRLLLFSSASPVRSPFPYPLHEAPAVFMAFPPSPPRGDVGETGAGLPRLSPPPSPRLLFQLLRAADLLPSL